MRSLAQTELAGIRQPNSIFRKDPLRPCDCVAKRVMVGLSRFLEEWGYGKLVDLGFKADRNQAVKAGVEPVLAEAFGAVLRAPPLSPQDDKPTLRATLSQ